MCCCSSTATNCFGFMAFALRQTRLIYIRHHCARVLFIYLFNLISIPQSNVDESKHETLWVLLCVVSANLYFIPLPLLLLLLLLSLFLYFLTRNRPYNTIKTFFDGVRELDIKRQNKFKSRTHRLALKNYPVTNEDYSMIFTMVKLKKTKRVLSTNETDENELRRRL